MLCEFILDVLCLTWLKPANHTSPSPHTHTLLVEESRRRGDEEGEEEDEEEDEDEEEEEEVTQHVVNIYLTCTWQILNTYLTYT